MPKISTDFVVKISNSWIERKGIAYIQMELCLGNLRAIIDSKAEAFGRQTNARLDSFEYFICCEILREVTQSLNCLHSLRPPIIHSNLKPENILLIDGKNGRSFKLCDFGLLTDQSSSPERKSNKYMSPELIIGEKESQKSDVYSLAVIANELFDFNIVTDLNQM